MKNIYLIMWVAASMIVSSVAWAADPADHSAYHPDASASIEAPLGMMQGMQEKMMTAKTPEEREAMMMRHQKMMHGCMSMMHRDMDQGGAGKMKSGMFSEMMERNKKMEQKMEHMERMMNMMMDRLPPAVNK